MTRILVTGGDGFIGRRVVALLRERGLDVIVVGRQPTADLVLDLLSARAPEVIAGIAPALVIHLAWTTAHSFFWSDPANVEWTAASIRIMRAAYDAGTQRFVGAGTCAEYAWPCSSCDENETPLNPSSLYGASKDAFRRVGEAYARERAVEFAWGRMFFVYGPGEPAQKLVSGAIADLRDGRIPRIRDTSRRLDFVYVDDVARGLADLATSPGVVGAFNLGSGTLHTVGEAIHTITGHLKIESLPAFRDPARVADASVGANLARSRAAFGYSPRVSLSHGIALTAEATLSSV